MSMRNAAKIARWAASTKDERRLKEVRAGSENNKTRADKKVVIIDRRNGGLNTSDGYVSRYQ